MSLEKELTTYEREQITAIEKWRQESPSVASKVAGLIAYPVIWFVQIIVPNAAIKGALDGANWAASWLADSRDIIRDGGVETIPDLKAKNLELSDRLANSVHNWAIGLAMTEGGITGVTGLPGLLADIPSIITFSLRTIHKIALCYGYECNNELDKKFVLGILSAAGANSMTQKTEALTTLKIIKVTIAKKTWKDIATKAASAKLSKEGGIIGIKNLAKQLGVNLTKRKALQAIPIIGLGVGASVNGAYIKDVGWTARRIFQERWLIDNKKVSKI